MVVAATRWSCGEVSADKLACAHCTGLESPHELPGVPSSVRFRIQTLQCLQPAGGKQTASVLLSVVAKEVYGTLCIRCDFAETCTQMFASDIWLVSTVVLISGGLNSAKASSSFGPKPEETLIVPGSIPLDTDGKEVRSPLPDLSDHLPQLVPTWPTSTSLKLLGRVKHPGKIQSLSALRL